MLPLLLTSLALASALADGPGGHHGHHGGHHGAHHGAHDENHAHHGDHGQHGGHPAEHGAQRGQHHTVHSSVQRPVSASFSIQAEVPRSQALTLQSGPPPSQPVVINRGPSNLAQIIASHPKLTTLAAALKASEISSLTLAGRGPITVFAPTDLAFKKLPEGTVSKLLADPAALTKILFRHVVPGTSIQGKNIPPGSTSLKTAGGEQISITRDKFIQVSSKEGSAFIVQFDVIGSNGVIHAVDTVF